MDTGLQQRSNPGNGNLITILQEAGFDFEHEMMGTLTQKTTIDVPRIRIEHKDNGKHRLYVDNGESYLDDDSQEQSIKGNTLSAIIFAEEEIRAMWQDGETVPVCAAINNKPTVDEPASDSCLRCEYGVMGGSCKPKQRLWMLIDINGEIKPVVMALSPTSIKHWQNHKRKLIRSKLPYVAVQTVLKLTDVKKNAYRWAEVIFDVASVASKEQLMLAKQARTELDKLRSAISESDFNEPGDKL